MPPIHSAMLVPNADITIAASRIVRISSGIAPALDAPDLRHTLPGLMADLTAAHQALMDKAMSDPDIKQALELGLRSTRELATPEESRA